jgi:hypothetical protein
MGVPMTPATVQIQARGGSTAGKISDRRTSLLLLTCTGFPLAGMLFVAAYSSANRAGGWVHELYWAAIAVSLATTAAIFVLAKDKRRAAAGLTVVLAVLLSLPKFLRAPQYFNFYDELAHLQASNALLQGHGLFATNPLNRVVTDYPGLHLVTAVTSAVTGASVYVAGSIVILLARVAGCLAVLLLAERLARSPLVGLLAVVIFVANPAFMFFDAQYAYESLALPLVAVILLLALRLADTGDEDRTPTFVAALFLSLAVVITHHSTSYVLAALLVLLLLVGRAARKPTSKHLVALCGLTIVAIAAWLSTVARYTFTYIGPYLRSNLTSLPDFLSGSDKPRQLFGGFLPVPEYERLASFAAIVGLAVLYVGGAWTLLRDRSGHKSPSLWVFALLGSALFISLPLVALRQDQVAKRIWEFAFIGIAPFCGVFLARWIMTARGRIGGRFAVAALLFAIFVGSGVMRSGEHIRFPGPYLPSADPRSMTPDVVAAARWLKQTWGPDHPIIGDRTLAATFGSYGDQEPITYQEDGRPVWKIFFSETLTPEVTQELRRSGTEWIAVDLRSAGKFPLTGYYFSESEPGAYISTNLTVRDLTKFDHGPFRRLYDNGHVVLYEVVKP